LEEVSGMRLQRYFALSFCLLIASLGCSSNSGNSPQPAAGQPLPNTTTGATAATQPVASPQTPGDPAVAVVNAPGQTAATTTAGATSPATPVASPANAIDACALLTSDDIKSVQGEAVQEAKPNRRTDSPFAVTQCFYMMPSFTKSVSLEVTQRGASAKSVHEFWEERVEKSGEESEREREYERSRARKGETEKERERERAEEREREAKTPRRLKGIGDEAYWINTNANSTMYIFKKDTLLRISIGGADGEAARMKKIKALALKALARL
jgi:hypothetical protein